MARPHTFDRDPSLEDDFARMLHEGCPRSQLAAAFDIHIDTVTDWRKRPSVEAKVSKLNKARATRIASLVDTKVEQRLTANKDIPLRDLLEIRRTFVGTGDGTEDTAPSALEELVKAMHSDPEAAEQLQAALKGADDDPDA